MTGSKRSKQDESTSSKKGALFSLKSVVAKNGVDLVDDIVMGMSHPKSEDRREEVDVTKFKPSDVSLQLFNLSKILPFNMISYSVNYERIVNTLVEYPGEFLEKIQIEKDVETLYYEWN